MGGDKALDLAHEELVHKNFDEFIRQISEDEEIQEEISNEKMISLLALKQCLIWQTRVTRNSI